jgi:hypothetical protein
MGRIGVQVNAFVGKGTIGQRSGPEYYRPPN